MNSMTLPTSAGCLVALNATIAAPPGMAEQPAGPQGCGGTIHSNLSPMSDWNFWIIQEPATCIATSPLMNMSPAFFHLAPDAPGQMSGGIRPSLCHCTMRSAAALKPSSTTADGLPWASKYFAPMEIAMPAKRWPVRSITMPE